MSLLIQDLCFEADHDIHMTSIWNNLIEAIKILVTHILTIKAQQHGSWNYLCNAQQQGF